MRVPDFGRWIHYLQGLALVLCGMIIGAALFMSITHHQLNDQITKNRSLDSEIKKLLDDNESLKKYKNKQTIIKSVSVGVENNSEEEPLNEIIINEIKQRIEQDLATLKGQPISYIDEDPQNIRNIYGKRIIPNIHEKDYIVEIHTILVIYGELKLWITAKEYFRQTTVE